MIEDNKKTVDIIEDNKRILKIIEGDKILYQEDSFEYEDSYVKLTDGTVIEFNAYNTPLSNFYGMSNNSYVLFANQPIILSNNVKNIKFGDSYLIEEGNIGNSFLRNLGNINNINFSGLRNITGILSQFCRDISINNLDLSPFSNVNSVSQAFLNHILSLKYLNLSPMISLNTIGNYCIADLPSLETLKLNNLNNLSQIGIGFLELCPNLKEIHIGDIDWTDIIIDGSESLIETQNNSNCKIYCKNQELGQIFKNKFNGKLSNWTIVPEEITETLISLNKESWVNPYANYEDIGTVPTNTPIPISVNESRTNCCNGANQAYNNDYSWITRDTLIELLTPEELQLFKTDENGNYDENENGFWGIVNFSGYLTGNRNLMYHLKKLPQMPNGKLFKDIEVIIYFTRVPWANDTENEVYLSYNGYRGTSTYIMNNSQGTGSNNIKKFIFTFDIDEEFNEPYILTSGYINSLESENIDLRLNIKINSEYDAPFSIVPFIKFKYMSFQ